MRTIHYSYRGSHCNRPLQPPNPIPAGYYDRFYALSNSVTAEQSGDHVDGIGQPVTVSRFLLNCLNGTRTEWNGLGAWRIFYFGSSAATPGQVSHGYETGKVTDFTRTSVDDVPNERQSHLNGYPYQHWDGRGLVTQFTHADSSDLPSEIRHLDDGSFRTFDRIHPGNSAPPDPDRIHNPDTHWLFSQTDEHPFTTTYTRDARRRVTRIDYADTSFETFTYKNYGQETFNQVETHALPSGAVVTYVYDDTTHRLMAEYNSVDGWDARKEYTYDSLERVATVSDGRSRSAGKDFSTRMTYNGWHKVLTVEYAGMIGAANPTVGYGYDSYGNCTSITDEMGHTSTYTYDSYRRCTSYTEPLNAANWNGSALETARCWDWFYDRWIDGVGQVGAYTHTKNEWRIQIEPAFNAAGDRRMTARAHDLQNRIVTESTGWIQPAGGIGNWYWSGADGENHSWTYDENGNKKTYTDPQSRLTTYTYDLRNRLKDTIETKRADQSVNPTTTILYDTTGNKTDVTFPDTRSQHWRDYDPFGQPGRFIDERNNTTNLSYIWGPMKKLFTVTTHRLEDGGGMEDQQTVFSYYPTGRPQTTVFPDGSNEYSTYEFGQLKTWRTRKNQTKTIIYDARGREQSHSWDDGVTPTVARAWDDANRLSAISNIFSSIDYGYDDAGQVIWEGDEIAGSGGRTQTNYYRYPDGSVAHLHYPGGAFIRNDYTARGQLKATGWDDDDNNWWMQLAHYTYLADGKVGQIDYGNGVRSAIGYDERGFAQIVDHYNVPANRDISWRQYWRDDRDRITAYQKSYNPGANPMENGRGDRFRYDDEGELIEAWYNASDPANSGAGNTRYDGFAYDALGNRTQNNYVASRGLTSFVRRDNALNQYVSWSPSIIYHDDNYPGSSAPGNGVMMAEGWITASFNAVNQPLAIWSPNMPAGAFTWFGYDPLGRCVKRWISDSSDVYSNPATYFHYDGWNLLQEGMNAWGPARVYVHGNRMDELVWSYNTFTGDQAFHHYDARGHCTLLTESLGNILEQYEYDAFGQAYFYNAAGMATTVNDQPGSPFGNRFLFTGREWLSDLRLYDFRNRMYQPELGRFLQPDPKQFAAGDYNLYRYCHNDPINKSDPTGLVWTPMSEKDRKDYEKAKEHTASSDPARRLFDRIEHSRKEFTLSTNNKHNDSFDRKHTVNWDPRSAFKTNEGGTQSPALRLLHEIDHALTNPVLQSLRTLFKDRAYDNAEERRVIRGSEARIARDIGEAGRYDHHYYNDTQLYHVAEPGDR